MSEKINYFNKQIIKIFYYKLIIIIIKTCKIIFQIFIGYTFYFVSKYNKIKKNIKLKREIKNELVNYIYNENLFYNKSKKSLSKMKKVIFTVILGGYDELKPFNKEKGFDYYIFCDRYNESNNSNWTFLPVPKEINNINISRVKKQRYIKLHPHIFFKNYELSIYLDGTFQILGNLNEFLFRILSPNYNIYILEHPERDSIYDEIREVIFLNKEKESMGEAIMNRYKNENFEDKNGLIESCIIIRKHNNKECIFLMNKWFNEIVNYSHRDQLSYNYLIWKTGIKFKYIPKNLALEYLNQTIFHLVNLIYK